MRINVCSIEELRARFKYDPESGNLIHLKNYAHANAGDICKYSNDDRYLSVAINGKRYGVHRIAWALYYGEWASHLIDHINFNKKDNRICNLREATHSENNSSRLGRLKNKTGFKGVSINRGKYVARICHNKKHITIGYFDDPQIAAHEYNKYAIKLHGEFASLNPVGVGYE